MSRKLAEGFVLRRVVGRGPHGVVWMGRHEATHELCAIKVLDPRLASDATVRERFLRESTVC